MGAGHGHADGPSARLHVHRAPRIAVIGLIALCGLAALLGVVRWWPDEARVDRVRDLVPAVAAGVATVHGDLLTVRPICTRAGEQQQGRCGASRARVLDGASAGRAVAVDLSPDVIATGLRPGDRVLLLDTSKVDGGQGSGFSFFRTDRGGSMVWLVVLFAVAVVLVARLRGVMALVSLAIAGAVVVGFLLPALLGGAPPVPVTLAAGVLILITILYATHGVSMRTSVALVGALLGVALSTAFAWFGVIGSRLGGLGDEPAALLVFNVPWIDVQHLVVASVIVAGLGTLNDVTITQVSAVWELREASPAISRTALFRRAMRIGRDHVASTVYTLVFAYLGTALVLLVAVQLYGGTAAGFATSEDVAEEIVRTLVGGIGLVLAMPVTTALGVLVVPSDAVRESVGPGPVRRSAPARRPVAADNPYRRMPAGPWYEG